LATIISKESVLRHSVDKYNFKVLSIGEHLSSTSEEIEESPKLSEASQEAQENSIADTHIDSSAMSQSSKDSLIESLMKKTDEMSSNFIKLQMKLEDKEAEYEAELKVVEEEAYNKGIKEGKLQAAKDDKTSYKDGVSQFSTSISTLEESAKQYEIALESIKSQLISAAVDISKEVINVELSESSQEIAKILSDELIKELQSASKITLKVNPQDHGAISEHVGSLEHVEVLSDSAVSIGGVVAISDAGNIDAQISKRFQRVKRAALSE
jgi:flagellar assembly protein FliH